MRDCSPGAVRLILDGTMAKVELNSVIKALRGSIGGVVFKRYGNRIVASKYPDMSGVKRTPAQNAQLGRMKWAAIYYRYQESSEVHRAVRETGESQRHDRLPARNEVLYGPSEESRSCEYNVGP